MLLFTIYMIIWVILGFATAFTMDEWKGTNWFGVFFFIMFILIPIVADFAGVL